MGLYNFSEDINVKYAEIEEDLNRRLETVLTQEEKLKVSHEKSDLFDNYVENTASLAKAMERNENTIKVIRYFLSRVYIKTFHCFRFWRWQKLV